MIRLAPLAQHHAASFYPWLRDPEVIEYSLSAFQHMHTETQINEWLAATLQNQASFNLGIFLTDSDELIGYAGLSGISATNLAAEFFILIGQKSWWGRGIGTAVARQVLALGFTEHELNRIMLTVSETNIGGLKAYARAGFVVEGRQREACRRNGRFHDKIMMAVLKSEWKGVTAGT
ncbi:GNAT family N-acetyltransferase [Hymenobacter puniceus]|uniref:GNAT family N-acetyltransferase n=1 Tax=Hymenobacter sp. BT190 TaxID=2763505 RepID=UPI0016510A3E|nr:GNAT family protein [Hymenobacter sp. BT190]MBC6699576.1 GNAT family N-acetyltransferase [Hymenobacter sp. BT190]